MGILTVCALPIDNDWRTLDPRVGKALKIADLLIAEERKNALRLLAATDCRDKEFVLINEHSSDAERQAIVAKIKRVENAVLVSDAGTPCIADPDWRLVDECIKQGVRLRTVPGASSITSALSVSGIPADKFIYLGFPPKDNPARKTFFANLTKYNITAVFTERPYALSKTLEELGEHYSEVGLSAALGCENELNLRGTPKELLQKVQGMKEPFIIVVKPQLKK